MNRHTSELSIRYSERLTDAGATASVGSVADIYDNAMAEALNGSFKAELIEHQGLRSDHRRIAARPAAAGCGWDAAYGAEPVAVTDAIA